MQRRSIARFGGMGVVLLSTLLVVAGCSHRTPTAPAVTSSLPAPGQPAPPAAPAAATSDFQPYTLVAQPAPKPRVVTHRHHVLHLVRRAHGAALADSSGRLYDVGRDAQGHLYPVYHDKATGAAYPLFYDGERDRLYRVARADDGRFYRGYVDDPGDRFYAADRDYETVTPSEQDRPIIENSYDTTVYRYGAAAPPAHAPHGGHHNDWNWLWAIPVIVGAYLVLHPHHHSPPPYRYVSSGRPTAPVTVVRRNNPVTVINNTIINNNLGQRVIYSPPPPRVPLTPLVGGARSVRPVGPHTAALAPKPRTAALRRAVASPPVRPRVAAVQPRAVPPLPPKRRAPAVLGPKAAPPVRPILAARPKPVAARPRPAVHHFVLRERERPSVPAALRQEPRRVVARHESPPRPLPVRQVEARPRAAVAPVHTPLRPAPREERRPPAPPVSKRVPSPERRVAAPRPEPISRPDRAMAKAPRTEPRPHQEQTSPRREPGRPTPPPRRPEAAVKPPHPEKERGAAARPVDKPEHG